MNRRHPKESLTGEADATESDGCLRGSLTGTARSTNTHATPSANVTPSAMPVSHPRWMRPSKPVSYTHLDVYKRQVMRLGLLLGLMAGIALW